MDNEMNPPHLRNLLKNPGYYEPDMEDIKLGDDIVIGEYASNRYGEPTIRWTEVVVEELPLWKAFPTMMFYRKKLNK
jgi:hypothetical protein